jgi:hypothetical protein
MQGQFYGPQTDLFTSPHRLSHFRYKVRDFLHLDFPTLINVDDEVHEPSNLLDELSSVLIISFHLSCPFYQGKEDSPFSHRRCEHDCLNSALPILGKRTCRCSW